VTLDLTVFLELCKLALKGLGRQTGGEDDLNAYITGQFDAAEANDEPPDNDEVS
jgi:hypothetical protein